ncbi:MAG: hypothetical protein WC845_00490 [Candidatus Staskawiczbacteria bacterium]|jgi:hypothetical protein
MKKSLIALSIISVVLLTPILAFAQPSVTVSDLGDVIEGIQNVVWQIFGLIAVICFVIAGILFLSSGGNPEKVSAARSAFLWGIAGVVVGILAYSIIAIVEGFL